MLKSKGFSLVKPSLHTSFHIDFEWWRQNGRDWRVYLRSYLSPEDQQDYSESYQQELVDLVDPDTAEVHQVDGLHHLLISRHASRSDFITQSTSVTEAIFRLFLSRGNTPMSANELAERLQRSPTTILRMLSGRRVYKGIRPIIPN